MLQQGGSDAGSWTAGPDEEQPESIYSHAHSGGHSQIFGEIQDGCSSGWDYSTGGMQDQVWLHQQVHLQGS